MEIVSSDDDNDECFSDTVMMLRQDFLSDSSSDGEDGEETLFVWGDRHRNWGIYTRKASNIEHEKVGSRIIRSWNTYSRNFNIFWRTARCAMKLSVMSAKRHARSTGAKRH
jgi:hypothetical protein